MDFEECLEESRALHIFKELCEENNIPESEYLKALKEKRVVLFIRSIDVVYQYECGDYTLTYGSQYHCKLLTLRRVLDRNEFTPEEVLNFLITDDIYYNHKVNFIKKVFDRVLVRYADREKILITHIYIIL